MNKALQDELDTVWQGCHQPNWDGYGAVPVSEDTVRNARAFLRALPAGIPVPSLGAEPDGSITMDWHRAPRHMLSVSVGTDGGLVFAALLGPTRIYGTEAFHGEPPKRIMDLARTVLGIRRNQPNTD